MKQQLPPAWLETTIGELFRTTGGGTPSTTRSEFWGNGVPWITSADIDDAGAISPRKAVTRSGIASSATNPVPRNSVIVVTRVGLGKAGLAEQELCFSQDCQALLFNPGLLDPSFVAHQTRCIVRGIRGRGTTIAGVTVKELGALPFSLAPLPEQHRITDAIDSYLTRVDDAVATLERVQEKLKSYRASVLKAAVEGRLVPTEASLARADNRAYEPAEALLVRILKERRRRWEEAELANLKAAGKTPKDDKWKAKYDEPLAPDTSKLPELPDGWCWASWPQVGFSQNGRAFPSAEYRDMGIRLLRPGNLHESGRVEWNEKNSRHMPERWASDHPSYLVGPDELVINLTAQSLADEFLGRICLTAAGEHCLLNQRIARLTPVLLSARFLLCVFKSPWFRKFVASLNTGSLIQHMFTTQLDDFVLPLPPLVEQDRIAAEVERRNMISEVCATSARSSIRRAQALRQAVLKWACQGKLVDQDPTDEPADELLARIRAERASVSSIRKGPGRRARGAA